MEKYDKMNKKKEMANLLKVKEQDLQFQIETNKELQDELFK